MTSNQLEQMKQLTIVMELPERQQYRELRKTGRALGVPVLQTTDAEADYYHESDGSVPVYALETWRGQEAHNLRDFVFPQKMVLLTGALNRGLDVKYNDWLDGSIYIDQTNWGETFLSPAAAGAIAIYQFHLQRGV